MKGLRYSVEFPIVGKNVDVFRIMCVVEDTIKQGYHKYSSRIRDRETFKNQDNVSQKIDYQVASSTANGANCTGTIYIRGIKGPDGNDSFKFIMEKSNDFSELDAEVMIEVLQEVNRMYPPT